MGKVEENDLMLIEHIKDMEYITKRTIESLKNGNDDKKATVYALFEKNLELQKHLVRYLKE